MKVAHIAGICMLKQPSSGRQLSHDEQKAAEAAFQGRPFNDAWSQAARTVYDGIVAVVEKRKSRSDKRRTGHLFHDLDEMSVPVVAMACRDDE